MKRSRAAKVLVVSYAIKSLLLGLLLLTMPDLPGRAWEGICDVWARVAARSGR
jgi:hypothetical protein